MFRVIFTQDYEIHGSGMGSPWQLMVEPTERMLEQFDHYGAKLTIMADVAEVMQFKRHYERTGQDTFWSQAIEAQLRRAVSLGHDVQLHIHSGYLNATYRDGVWQQDYADYDLARLGYDRLVATIAAGKQYLEELLRPVKAEYVCNAFRAANWSVHPSRDVAEALIKNGFSIDTSVFKYGRSNDLVNFDYENAYSALVPWPASRDDLCQRDEAGPLFEFPIYCERQPIWTFLTPNRVYRVVEQLRNPLPPPPAAPGATPTRAGKLARLTQLTGKLKTLHPWKADFNQCSGRQLVASLRRAESRYGGIGQALPFVLIGHSKTFTRVNELSLRPFLRFVRDNPDRFGFGTFGDFDLTKLRTLRAC